MGKDKEDSGFGFKDKAKALDTLRLLEEHDMNYRRLTVRGLLGRAKRVLSLTKAEDKIKNIKEAMEVFEKWLEEQSKDNPSKKEKADKKKEDKKEIEDQESGDEESKPSDTVPGLGFKDAATAEGTLKALEGRDPDYQKLAVKGLLGRAERSLTCTRDETKIANIKAAIAILKKFLDEYEEKNLGKHNNSYLSLGIVRTCLKTAEERGLDVAHQKQFIAAYTKVGGDYKKLRTVFEKNGGKTWDIVRNAALKELKEKFDKTKLFDDEDKPSDEHLQLMLWAYSPEPNRVKKLIQESHEENDDKRQTREGRKRKSSGGEEGSKRKKE